jgi:hypothetical protein
MHPTQQSAQPILSTEFDISLYDIVRLNNGDEMIITVITPDRPVNPFCGILVNGKGAEYKFGSRNHPVVSGHANPNHPALVAFRRRHAERAGQVEPSTDAQAIIFHLLDAVESGDLSKAKILAAAIRTMDQFRKNK